MKDSVASVGGIVIRPLPSSLYLPVKVNVWSGPTILSSVRKAFSARNGLLFGLLGPRGLLAFNRRPCRFARNDTRIKPGILVLKQTHGCKSSRLVVIPELSTNPGLLSEDKHLRVN